MLLGSLPFACESPARDKEGLRGPVGGKVGTRRVETHLLSPGTSRRWQGCDVSSLPANPIPAQVERRTSGCPAATVPIGKVLHSSPGVQVVPRVSSVEFNYVTRLTVLCSRLPEGEVRRRAPRRSRTDFLPSVPRTVRRPRAMRPGLCWRQGSRRTAPRGRCVASLGLSREVSALGGTSGAEIDETFSVTA